MPFTAITPIAFTMVCRQSRISHRPRGGLRGRNGGAGQIRSWIMDVLFAAHGLPPSIITIFDTEDPDNSFDEGSYTIDSIGVNNGAPGTWTTVGNVSDTGSTLSLMMLTLMALRL